MVRCRWASPRRWTSTTQTEFTFTVRDGVTWSDGTPLNAHDFEWSWKRVLDPETKSEYTSALYPLKNAVKIDKGELSLDELGVKAVDDYHLQVTLEGPTPFFPLLAATWTFYPVPRHVVEGSVRPGSRPAPWSPTVPTS